MTGNMSVNSEGLQAARQLLAAVLEIEAADIADDVAIGVLASWNSLAHMRLIMALEAQMGTSLSPGNVVAIGSLQDIATVLEGRELTVSGI